MGKRGDFLLSYICGPFFRFFLQFCDSHISSFEMPCSFILRYLDVCFCWCDFCRRFCRCDRGWFLCIAVSRFGIRYI